MSLLSTTTVEDDKSIPLYFNLDGGVVGVVDGCDDGSDVGLKVAPIGTPVGLTDG